MEITIQGTEVVVTGDRIIGFAINNLVNRFEATTDKDESWFYTLKIFMTRPKKFNIINLNREAGSNILYVDLTRDMMPFGGRYEAQFVAYKEGEVDQTEIFDFWVSDSLNPECAYDPVPSEFYQIEDNIHTMYEEVKQIYDDMSQGLLDIDVIDGGNASTQY